MTNYEKIKAMSVEKMAFMLAGCMNCSFCPASEICDNDEYDGCEEHLEKWLLQEAEE